jgi:MoaA/NifB/PqqE/SkfB family radical SAM enzyme
MNGTETGVYRIKKLHWNAWSACNMSCGFCYLWRSQRSHALSTGVARRLIAETSDLQIGTFVFGGGDPLLREDLCELIRYAKERNLRTDLQTNGIALTEHRLAKMAPYLDRIGLSFDGEVPVVHDAVRGCPKHFEVTHHALDLCERYAIPVTIRTLVCRANLGRIAKLVDLLKNYTVITKWSLREFVPCGRGFHNRDQFSLPRSLYLEDCAQIREYCSKYKVRFHLVSLTTDDMHGCYCLVSSDGVVYGHPRNGEYESVGIFPEETLAELLTKLDYDAGARSMRDKAIPRGTQVAKPARGIPNMQPHTFGPRASLAE